MEQIQVAIGQEQTINVGDYNLKFTFDPFNQEWHYDLMNLDDSIERKSYEHDIEIYEAIKAGRLEWIDNKYLLLQKNWCKCFKILERNN